MWNTATLEKTALCIQTCQRYCKRRDLNFKLCRRRFPISWWHFEEYKLWYVKHIAHISTAWCKMQYIHYWCTGDTVVLQWPSIWSITLVFFHQLQIGRVSAGNGTISVKFVQFSNPAGEEQSGSCCDGTWIMCQNNGCDHKFTICLHNNHQGWVPIVTSWYGNVFHVTDSYLDQCGTLAFPLSLKLIVA